MRALLVQPPFVQLNAPYPAAHYLEAFLRGRGIEAKVADHSIELYRRVFSRRGLRAIFEEAEAGLASGKRPRLGPRERAELERYLSYRPLYEVWIEDLVGFLSGGDPAFAHRLAAAAEFPRGARAEAFLEASGGRIGPEGASRLATAILEDLGDFIAFAVDPEFGTVRYGERLGRSRGDFREVETALRSGFIMEGLYRPLLRAWLEAEAAAGEAPKFLLVTLPFPGCLLGALACAEEARRRFGPGLRVVFGGGYVSTELRGLREPRLFDYCDYLVFDAGYGGLLSILEAEAGGQGGLFRVMRRDGQGRIHTQGFREGDLAADPRGSLPAAAARDFPEREAEPCPEAARFLAAEEEALSTVEPDYRDLEPSRYLRPLDSSNPMHRLWSESPWLKYRLAQGCYWRRCAFCDTQLDYVADYRPTELGPLLAAAGAAAERHGLYGLHFTDEALPLGRLLAFAQANRERAARGERPFHYWGNARFDASWTEARCELLAASGLIAVSGGIEVASERGLAMTDKGFDLRGLVKCLLGMRRAGLLVHAYLIYGFPGQDEAGIEESAEIARQLFAAGLIDSAFWHRFVLTRHSRMITELRSGARSYPKPLDRGGAFAANDLEFEGEAAYDAYGPILDAALAEWMAGEGLDRPFSLRKRGSGRGKERGADPELVERLLEAAETELDRASLPPRATAHWLGGLPQLRPESGTGGSRLCWAYRGKLEEFRAADQEAARRLAGALEALAKSPEGQPLNAFLAEAGLAAGAPLFGELRGRGLVAV